ncbi:MAG TPA: peptidoglycan-binding domain-containing protein [Candidatus Tectomicrobia bacterium]|nr:peptidoglycan-binding domain-containing protein [Candidatus Tectomicrobia bacterium]
MKRTLLTVGLSAMLAMPVLAAGQSTSTTRGMESGRSGPATPMEQRGRQDMSQEQVREAQKELKDIGYYKGSIDGQMGAQTQQAIREYQKSRGLPETGQLDEPTRELLLAQKMPQSPGRMDPSPGSSRGVEPSGSGRTPSTPTPGGTGPSSSR